MATGGFWSKILVSDAQWATILKRIQHKDLPNRALSAGGFWSKVLVPDGQWEIILKRIREDRIPDVAMSVDNEWQTARKLLHDQRLKTCFSTDAFWTNCTKDWTSFFKHAQQSQKKITQKYLSKYAKEHPLFHC